MKQTLLSEGDLLTYLPHIYFTVYKIIANNNKTLFEDFFLPKPILGTHTVHDLSLRLRTPY